MDPEGPSVYRPEAGSYISNIAAANSLFSHRLHDRLGEPQYTDSLHSQGSASSMWMRHVGGHERFRTGDGQLNTQANRYVLQLGGDLAQWSSNAQDRWHLGVMAGYANQHSNTQSNRVGYKSDGRISGYSAGLYATWYQNDANKTGAYVDSWALYNWFDNSVSSDNRSADDYDSRGVTASVEGGYTFEAGTFSGSEGTLNTWYVQPQVQITWMGVKDSDHTRKDGTRIETEGDGNVQTRLGVKTYLNSHHQRDDGKQREFQPYIEANWINNSKVYAVKMNGQTVSRDGARNLGEVRTGVEAKVNNNLHGGQKLTLAEHGGAYGATADMSAKIGGEGDLAINTVRQVSLSNGQNDYQGATYVQMGTLRTDADGALGNTRELNISNAAIVDLNGSAQTVETFTGLMGSTVLFKEGSLTVNKGGISQGELTGGGNLNVTGGTLAIEGLNARYNALTSVSPNAEVSLDNTQGLGRGNIANDGLLTLKNVTGELRNSISGKGIVSATARTDVELDGDNSRVVGQFNIDTGSALSVNEQKNLGDASVINNGLLTISTERSWAMTHSISGSGDVTKLGTGILTLNKDSAAYQGTTDIVGGEIAFGSDSAINMASQHINIHNSGVMSGNVTTAGDVNVMPGGTLRVAKTTVGGNLENGGTVQMNSEGGKPGNVLTVNGNYTGNNGLMTFNATLGGDNSPTDKMNVKGDTQGNTRVRVDNIGGVGALACGGMSVCN